VTGDCGGATTRAAWVVGADLVVAAGMEALVAGSGAAAFTPGVAGAEALTSDCAAGAVFFVTVAGLVVVGAFAGEAELDDCARGAAEAGGALFPVAAPALVVAGAAGAGAALFAAVATVLVVAGAAEFTAFVTGFVAPIAALGRPVAGPAAATCAQNRRSRAYAPHTTAPSRAARRIRCCGRLAVSPTGAGDSTLRCIQRSLMRDVHRVRKFRRLHKSCQ